MGTAEQQKTNELYILQKIKETGYSDLYFKGYYAVFPFRGSSCLLDVDISFSCPIIVLIAAAVVVDLTCFAVTPLSNDAANICSKRFLKV